MGGDSLYNEVENGVRNLLWYATRTPVDTCIEGLAVDRDELSSEKKKIISDVLNERGGVPLLPSVDHAITAVHNLAESGDLDSLMRVHDRIGSDGFQAFLKVHTKKSMHYPVTLAAMNGHRHCVKYLIETGGRMLTQTSDCGHPSPIRRLCYEEHANVAPLVMTISILCSFEFDRVYLAECLQQIASFPCKTLDGCTVTHKFLASQMETSLVMDDEGKSKRRRVENPPYLSYLRREEDIFGVLKLVVQNGCQSCCQKWIQEAGAEKALAMQDGQGQGLLHYAVAGENAETTEWLRQQGAFVGDLTKTPRSSTVLHLACKKGRMDLVEGLLGDVKPDTKQEGIAQFCLLPEQVPIGRAGSSPLWYAITGRMERNSDGAWPTRSELIGYLLKNASLSHIDFVEFQACALAVCERDDKQSIRVFCEKGWKEVLKSSDPRVVKMGLDMGWKMLITCSAMPFFDEPHPLSPLLEHFKSYMSHALASPSHAYEKGWSFDTILPLPLLLTAFGEKKDVVDLVQTELEASSQAIAQFWSSTSTKLPYYPLLAACEKGDVGSVRALLEKGVPFYPQCVLDSINEERAAADLVITPLQISVYGRHVEVVKVLLGYVKDSIDAQRGSGYTDRHNVPISRIASCPDDDFAGIGSPLMLAMEVLPADKHISNVAFRAEQIADELLSFASSMGTPVRMSRSRRALDGKDALPTFPTRSCAEVVKGIILSECDSSRFLLRSPAPRLYRAMYEKVKGDENLVVVHDCAAFGLVLSAIEGSFRLADTQPPALPPFFDSKLEGLVHFVHECMETSRRQEGVSEATHSKWSEVVRKFSSDIMENKVGLLNCITEKVDKRGDVHLCFDA